MSINKTKKFILKINVKRKINFHFAVISKLPTASKLMNDIVYMVIFILSIFV